MRHENATTKFPSQFAPPQVKNSEKYCQQYSEAFHTEAAYLPTENALVRGNKNYERFRAYARGEQSTLQYKELMTLKRDKKGPNTSFRNLNFEILKIAPKMRNAVVNKVFNQPFQLTAKAIDPKSISAKRRYKSKLLEFVINKEEIERFEMLTKLGLERPVPPGEIPPSTSIEVDPYMDQNPKDTVSMEVLDFLKLNFYENDWDQKSKGIIGDIFDYGVGGTTQYIDVDGKIKIRKVMPDRCITNKCVNPDFSDLIRFGEYYELTISDIRRRTKGRWGENVYKEIANKYAQGGQSRYSNSYQSYFDASTYSYAYDHERVTVLDCMWKSVDTEVHKEYYTESGNRRLKKMEHDYVPFRGDMTVNDGNGLSDEEYNERNKGKSSIMRTEVSNVYKCIWIVDSPYVFDHGLMKNMLRSSNKWQEAVLPVTLISTDFMSTIGIIEQPIDQVQLNYLQFQSHVAASKPPGIAIEKRALARLGKGGQGGKKWDPKEDLILFAETGNIVYDGYDQHGNPLQQKPFEYLPNGLSPGAREHFELMLGFIDLIRTMLGLNIITEGGSPPERLGKSVAELAFGASDNALSHIFAAYKAVYEKTARNVFYLLQNNVQRMQESDISESLGSESYKHFMLNRDLGLIDMGILIKEGPDQTLKDRIFELLTKMVDRQEIPGEEAIRIQMVDNPYRQLIMLRKNRMERERQRAIDQENLVRAQGEENTKTAMATEDAARKTEELRSKNAIREKEIEAFFNQRAKREEFTYNALLKKLEKEEKLDIAEREFIYEYVNNLVKGKMAIDKQEVANKKPKAVAIN